MIKQLSEVDAHRAIMVCIPASVKWDDYQKELDAVADRKQFINYKVSRLPKDPAILERCYVVYQGKVVGWQEVVGVQRGIEFTCSTTCRKWKGNFIQRTGPFHKVDGPQVGSFRGWRYCECF